MLVSSTSMNVASVTVSAVIHGLCFGAHGSACAGGCDIFDGGGAASNVCSLMQQSPLIAIAPSGLRTCPAAANDRYSGPDRARCAPEASAPLSRNFQWRSPAEAD